ncbi:MAG: hypothetical protein LBB91_03125 [Clostridiales bacterium]|nr:hypothetical protein [Clostridiales bacterium]
MNNFRRGMPQWLSKFLEACQMSKIGNGLILLTIAILLISLLVSPSFLIVIAIFALFLWALL